MAPFVFEERTDQLARDIVALRRQIAYDTERLHDMEAEYRDRMRQLDNHRRAAP